MKDTTQFTEFTIDFSKVPEDAASKLTDQAKKYEAIINADPRNSPPELDALKDQSLSLAAAAGGYSALAGQDLEASSKDSDRYASITIVKDDETQTVINNFSEKARNHYYAQHPAELHALTEENKNPEATMDMLLDYLQEVEPKITISVEQRKFLKEQWHQSGPPSLATLAMKSDHPADNIAAKSDPQRIFHIDSGNNLIKAEYKQTYASFTARIPPLETGQSADFTISRDFINHKTSVEFKSTGDPDLTIDIEKTAVDALGPAITNSQEHSTQQELLKIEDNRKEQGIIQDWVKDAVLHILKEKLNKGRIGGLNKAQEQSTQDLVQGKDIGDLLDSSAIKGLRQELKDIQNNNTLNTSDRKQRISDAVWAAAKKADIDKFVEKNKEKLPQKTKLTRVKESASRKASRLRSFMQKQVSSAYTTVSSISSKIRNRSNSQTL